MAGMVDSVDLPSYPDPISGIAQSLQRHAQNWHDDNAREFPWRNTSNPFHVLIAEILLRQTQAGRVAGPYLEVISMYPDPAALAEASPDELRRWFRPLGLFTRADYLISASRQIRDLHDGQVPRDLDSLIELPGIGTYSARCPSNRGHVVRISLSICGEGAESTAVDGVGVYRRVTRNKTPKIYRSK